MAYEEYTLMNFNYAVDSLLIYQNIKQDKIVRAICTLNKNLCEIGDIEAAKKDYYIVIGMLIEAAEKHGFSGNAYEQYITLLFLTDENLFSLCCEKEGAIPTSKSIYIFAQQDMSSLITMLAYSIERVTRDLGLNEPITRYTPITLKDHSALEQMLNKPSPESLINFLMMYYRTMGAGNLADYSMFNFDGEKLALTGIANNDTIVFDDIIGYNDQKRLLRENTEAFLQGLPAANTLLIGSRGTGKSSMVKALVNDYFNKGLRLIEVKKSDFENIPHLLKLLTNRGKHFIVFMDDLTFEDFETQFRYLKSILEGSAEKRPSNVLFYATSNRRHMVSELWKDKKTTEDIDIELHTSDAVNDKLALSDRFGLTVVFQKPTPDQFTEIVLGVAKRKNVMLPDNLIKDEINRYEVSQSGMSGRVAKHFIDQMVCNMNRQ